MTLTLDNFKRAIPQSILTRGREYYQLGLVTDLSENDADGWDAAIQGTDGYEVRINRRADGALETRCTCPYNWGAHCKHVAATLYAIEEAFPELLTGKRRKSAGKRATKLDRLRAAIEAAPREQLAAILLDMLKGDRDFQAQMMLKLGMTETADDIRSMVRRALKPPPGSHGFLDYWAADEAGEKIAQILTRAGGMHDTNPDNAVMIYQIVLEETTKALENADDSTGSLSSNPALAVEGLAAVADRLSPESRAALFDYCLKVGTSERFYLWEFGWDLLSLAVDLIDTKEQRMRLEAKLAGWDREPGSTPVLPSNFGVIKAALIRLSIISRLDGEAEAWRFMEANKHLTDFREMLIHRHIELGNYDVATALIQEALDQMEQIKHPFLFSYSTVAMYREQLLEIAQKRGETQGVIEQARALWLGRAGNEYFHLLKDTIPPAEWPEYRRALLAEKELFPETVAWAYAEEGLWLELRDLVFSHPHLLEQYQLELEARFPDETAALYKKLVERKLADTSSRATYHEAASLLIRMSRMGHGEEGKAIARRLIKQHPQRRAMIQELERVL